MKGKNHWVLEVWVGIKVKLQYKTLILIQIARLDVIQKFQGSLITFCDLHAQNLIGFHCCEPELWNTFLCDVQVSQDQHQFKNMDTIGLIIYAEKNPQVVQTSSK
jgi:hypothetical protein